MARVFVNDSTLTDIADAIREKNGTEDTYKPSQMADAVRGIVSGSSGEDLFQYATSLANSFRNATFADGYELKIYVPNIGLIETPNNRDISYGFRNTKGVKKISLKCDPTELAIAASYAFANSSVEEIDLSEFYPMFINVGAIFSGATKLNKIKGQLDFSRIKSGSIGPFSSCASLVDVELKRESVFVSFSINGSKDLSDTSIQSIIDGLTTVETAQTLTFHANVKAKLTEAQISQITSKNWTLA